MSTAQQLYNKYFPGNTGQAWTYGSVHGSEVEQGTDIFMPAGTAVRLPAAATFVWTNGYQSVFQLASGLGLNITHIIASAVRPGQQLAAGTVIGTVAPLSATPPGYYSSAEHIEVGIYNTPQDAINWVDSATHDPVAWLASLGGGKVSSSNGSGNGSGNSSANATSWTNPFAYGPLSPFYWGAPEGPGNEPGIVPGQNGNAIGVNIPTPFGMLTGMDLGHTLLIVFMGLALLMIGITLLQSLTRPSAATSA